MPKLLYTIPMGEYDLGLVDHIPNDYVLSWSVTRATHRSILLADYYATLREVNETIADLPPEQRASILIPLGIPALSTADYGVDPDIRTGDWLLGRIAASAA